MHHTILLSLHFQFHISKLCLSYLIVPIVFFILPTISIIYITSILGINFCFYALIIVREYAHSLLLFCLAAKITVPSAVSKMFISFLLLTPFTACINIWPVWPIWKVLFLFSTIVYYILLPITKVELTACYRTRQSHYLLILPDLVLTCCSLSCVILYLIAVFLLVL